MQTRILVVDDSRDAARTWMVLLELDGHIVRTAFDGNAAIQVAAEFRPDVALVDIGLPGIDGYGVARWMRGTFEGMLLIAVTGYGDDLARQRSRDAGFDHHLVKPVQFAALQNVLAGIAP